MAYVAEISRTSPTVILFVIDQSTSMGHSLHEGQSKSAFLADVLNKTIYTLVTNCSKADGVRDYFKIGVIAYSGVGARNGFKGRLANKQLCSISEVADTPLRIEERVKKVASDTDGVTLQKVKFPIWFDPFSRGKTSMCAGLGMAADILEEWCGTHVNAFPPTVLHVTDGHPTDGNPAMPASRIRNMGTEDGACLLFNLHVDNAGGSPIVFPSTETSLTDRYGVNLFYMSSELPSHALRSAKAKGYAVSLGARGFVYNAALESIVDFFDIGTRPSLGMVGAGDR
jgi:hypothetical protein